MLEVEFINIERQLNALLRIFLKNVPAVSAEDLETADTPKLIRTFSLIENYQTISAAMGWGDKNREPLCKAHTVRSIRNKYYHYNGETASAIDEMTDILTILTFAQSLGDVLNGVAEYSDFIFYLKGLAAKLCGELSASLLDASQAKQQPGAEPPCFAMTSDMAACAYETGKLVCEGQLRIDDAVQRVSDKTGMNRDSAKKHIESLSNVLKGEVRGKDMKAGDISYYLSEIEKEFGTNGLKNALLALEQHINAMRPGWTKIRLRVLLKKHKQQAQQD